MNRPSEGRGGPADLQVRHVRGPGILGGHAEAALGRRGRQSGGGVGPGLSPSAALAMGLKVDVDALPRNVLEQLEKVRLDLGDPAVALQLLKLNAVIGLTGLLNSSGTLQSVNHYNTCMTLGLTSGEMSDLVQYLLSLTFGGHD